MIADSLVGAVLPPPFDQELAEGYKKAAASTQPERVLGPIMRENDPVNTLLYPQIASLNASRSRPLKAIGRSWKPADLAATNVPVLVVVGENDTNFTPRLMHALHEMISITNMQFQAAGHSAVFRECAGF